MVNNILSKVIDGLFPGHCEICGLASPGPLPLCQGCREDLLPNAHCCRQCALPLEPANLSGADTRCGACLANPPPFDRAIAPWIYCDHFAYLVKRWKFHGEWRLTPLLASLWLGSVPGLPEVDMLVPVPLNWRRMLRRGRNQSQVLAKHLQSISPIAGAARLDARSVRRVRSTAAQSGMDARQRRSNLRGAFTASKRYDNLRIAIIDDVLTTGATASAMARVLRTAGAGRIDVWCLARTPTPGT
jgi:ComF family protein